MSPMEKLGQVLSALANDPPAYSDRPRAPYCFPCYDQSRRDAKNGNGTVTMVEAVFNVEGDSLCLPHAIGVIEYIDSLDMPADTGENREETDSSAGSGCGSNFDNCGVQQQ